MIWLEKEKGLFHHHVMGILNYVIRAGRPYMKPALDFTCLCSSMADPFILETHATYQCVRDNGLIDARYVLYKKTINICHKGP